MAVSDIFFADVTDLLFRDVRSLSTPSGRGGGAKTPDNWLAGLDEATPEHVAHELTERLAEALAREQDTLRRLALLFSCEEAAATVLAQIEHSTEAAPLPLPKEIQHAALAADSLLKALCISYGRVAEGMGAKERSEDFEQAVQQAALRAIRLLARRQLLAYRACATASGAAWKSIHSLYSMARCHGLAATQDAQSSIEQEYVTALLLAIADPARIPRESLPATHAFIAGLSPLTQVIESTAFATTSEAPAAFLLAPGLGRGGHGMSPVTNDQTLPPNSLVVDCSQVVAALVPHIEGNAAEPPLALETLNLLHDAWAGNTAERRFPRTQFMPHADLIVGFKEILSFFTGTAFSRRKSDAGGHDDESSSVSEWSIVNESPDGFGIRHLGAEHPLFDIGDLVVLRPREHNQVCICLVRRISQGGGHFELGLQQLGANATVVNLPSEDILGFGQQVMLLPHLPGFGNAAGVIAAASALKPHTIISDRVDGELKRFKLGSRVASSTAIDFHLLQPD